MPIAPTPAFNTLAGVYDDAFTHTLTGRLQRQRVWHVTRQQIQSLLSPTAQALELNCGTGEDALWLARQGFQVVATDVSPEMLAVAQKKAATEVEKGKIRFSICEVGQLQHWLHVEARLDYPPPALPAQPPVFDLVFSNFGGLNCLPPAAMAQLNAAIKTALRPGGQFIAVVMGRFCCWETLYFLLKGRPKQAFRRLRQGPVAARLDANQTVQTWYYAPLGFAALFPDFEVTVIRPIGICLPPSYLDPFFRRYPRLLSCLNRLEPFFKNRFWANGADHYLISFVLKDMAPPM